MGPTTFESKVIATQTGPARAVVGRRYHVVVRSDQFGNDEYDATLEGITQLDPNPYGEDRLRKFDFLHFVAVSNSDSGKGARDFTIRSLREIA